MKTNKQTLMRILVFVNLFYIGAYAGDQSSNGYYGGGSDIYNCSNIEDAADKKSCQADAKAARDDIRTEKATTKRKELCDSIKNDNRDMLQELQKNCGGQPISQCVESARSCKQSAVNTMMSLANFMPGNLSSNPCSTKDQKDQARQDQKDQDQQFQDAQQRLNDKYDQANQKLQEVSGQQYSMLKQLSQRAHEMNGDGIDTRDTLEQKDREKRIGFLDNLGQVRSAQLELAAMNRQLVTATDTLSHLGDTFFDDCSQGKYDAVTALRQQLQDMGDSARSDLSSMGSDQSSTTMAAYARKRAEVVNQYNKAKARFAQSINDSYTKCMKSHNEDYKSKAKAGKEAIHQITDGITMQEHKIQQLNLKMQTDMEALNQSVTHTVERANNTAGAKTDDINLTRAEYNDQLKQAATQAQAMQIQVQQFELQAKAKARMQLMSTMVTMMTMPGGSGSNLGDVAPYVEQYDTYTDQKLETEASCKPAARGNLGSQSLASAAGRGAR